MIDKYRAYFFCTCRHTLTVLMALLFFVAVPVAAQDSAEDVLAIPLAVDIKSDNTVVDSTKLGLHGLEPADNEMVAESDIAMSSTLPKNLSPWNMFMEADWLVKGVIISLAFASLLSWTVLLSKSFELALLKRALLKARITLTGSHSLADAANSGSTSSVGRGLIIAAVTELQLSSDILNKKESSISVINDGVKERVASSLSRMEAALTRRMMFGTGLLATIGAIAPFVGLFGTVWGIMNSFISISESQTTNLAVVAPGIAEALLATALGLVAAIPAVVIYNYFTRKILGLKAMVSDISAGVMRLVSRDLDRGMTLNIVTPTIPSARVAE